MTNIIENWKAMPPKRKALIIGVAVILLITIISLIVRASRRKDEKDDETEKPNAKADEAKSTEATSRKITVDIDAPGTVADLDPKGRYLLLGEWRDRVFETKKWLDEMPELYFPIHWRVKILPAYNNAVARFRVSNKLGAMVSVVFDPYKFLAETPSKQYCWHIYCEALSEDNTVPLDDTKALRAAIQDMLDRATKKAEQ